MKPKIRIAAGLVLACFLAGCAALAPGANPLVVRCEQTETVALATFNTVVHVDDSDRVFWSSKLPAFHTFAEWLRVPVTLNPTNKLPRGAAMVWSLDQVKLTYKAGLTTSNAVITALATVESALAQAQPFLAQTATLKP